MSPRPAAGRAADWPRRWFRLGFARLRNRLYQAAAAANRAAPTGATRKPWSASERTSAPGSVVSDETDSRITAKHVAEMTPMSRPMSHEARIAPNPAMNAAPAGAGSGNTNIWNARFATTQMVSDGVTLVRPCASAR